jgi:hypothetical protein
MNLNEKLHYYGRKIVLPSNKIKELCRKRFDGKLKRVIDFGSGTLYWSKWLAETFDCQVLAVDTQYNTNTALHCTSQYITLFSDIQKAFTEPACDCIWMCDVIHHLNTGFWDSIKNNIVEHKYIVIKDIDCNHRFGNQMNRLHDRIINCEQINNVNPDELQSWLVKNGYVVERFYLPKLWYPHFLIIAYRK